IVGEVTLAISMITGGAALAIDGATMWANGKWNIETLGWDSLALLPAGGQLTGKLARLLRGARAGRAAEKGSAAANAARTAETEAIIGDKVEAPVEYASEPETGTRLDKVTRSAGDVEDLVNSMVKQLPGHVDPESYTPVVGKVEVYNPEAPAHIAHVEPGAIVPTAIFLAGLAKRFGSWMGRLRP
ncbi:MAG TPA: hypothetical protein VE074_02735, partial [Jatrophihabitantaceae bacterium]|nr:hypothetical protein [Jatrophihabitantaceae bacterium]